MERHFISRNGQEGGLVDLPGVSVQYHRELVEVIKVNDPLKFADCANNSGERRLKRTLESEREKSLRK